MPELFLSVEKFKKFLEKAVHHYQQSAPRLAEWLDEMYVRLGEEEWKTITLEDFLEMEAPTSEYRQQVLNEALKALYPEIYEKHEKGE